MKNVKRRKNGNVYNTSFLENIIILAIIIVILTLWNISFKKYNVNLAKRESDLSNISQNTIIENNDKDWNLILVNKWNKIPDNYNIDLVEVPSGEKVDKRINEPLMKMLEDAKKSNLGKEPIIVSGYRTNKKQKELYENKINEYKRKRIFEK